MNWKKWPYWLIGGIDAVGICLLVIASMSKSDFLYDVSSLLYDFVCKLFINCIPQPDLNSYDAIVFNSMVVGSFIAGALLGWLYGKIKGRRKVENV